MVQSPALPLLIDVSINNPEAGGRDATLGFKEKMRSYSQFLAAINDWLGSHLYFSWIPSPFNIQN